MQASDLLRPRLARVVQGICGDEVEYRAEDSEDKTRVEPQDVDGDEGDEDNAVLAPCEFFLHLCTWCAYEGG